MSNMRFEKSSKQNSGKGKGFYVALGVCLIAIGAAAWTTYDGVKQFVTPQTSTSSKATVSESKSEQEAGNPMSGVTVEVSSEPQTEVSSQASSKAEEASPSSAPEVPADTQPQLCVYPAGKTVIKEFSGERPVFSLTLNDWRVHEGTDFIAEKGSVVRAVTAGTVKEVLNDPMLGVTLVIEHKDFTAYYSGLGETTLVKAGDAVQTAQEIGSIKSVPSECVEEAHLHLGVKQNGKWIDPMTILESN